MVEAIVLAEELSRLDEDELIAFLLDVDLCVADFDFTAKLICALQKRQLEEV